MIRYNTMAIREDKATLGSDPSALMVAYSMGRHLLTPPFYGFTYGSPMGTIGRVMLVPQSDKSIQHNVVTRQLFRSCAKRATKVRPLVDCN